MTPANSGTAAAPITYQAYNNEKVTIDGANLVSGWTQYSGNIYQSSSMNWTMGGQDDQVFVDGQMVNFARWPNTSLDVSQPTLEYAGPNTTGTQNANGTLTETVYDANLTQPAGYWNGATIHIETGATWIYEAATITSYTRAVVSGVSYGVITFSSSFTDPNYNIAGQGDPYFLTGDPYFTGGAFQTLSASGSFYRDPNTGNLYLWTPAGDSPASHVIEAKAREWAFNLSGDSYININGINIFAAGIDSSSSSSHLLINGVNAQYVSHFLDYSGAWSSQLSNGSYVNQGTGIILDGNYDTLENSTIAYSAGDGVFLGGNNESVENNTIHDVDYAGLPCAGIDEAQFSGATTANDDIGYNTVYNSGRADISVSGLSASRVHNNTLWSPMQLTADGAAIYGYDGNGGGTEIDHNVIYGVYDGIGGFPDIGIFLDDYSTGYTIDHNLIYNSDEGIKLFEANTNNILNNTIANTSVSLDIYGSPSGTIANNLFSSPEAVTVWDSNLTFTDNLNTSSPAYVSSATGNYQLQSTSSAINAGTVMSPYTNGYVGSAPDIGAFEYGAAAWTAGASNSAAVLAGLALPSGWTAADIGAPTIPGSSVYSNGVFAVTGAGTDIWNASDQFRFVSTPVSGNQTIVARVASQTNPSGWAKAGIMFRSTSAANSAFVAVVTTPSNGVNLLSRDASGNLGVIQAGAVTGPVWLKLVRSGNVFTAFDSVDGINWTSVGSITMALPAAGLMGLAVTSANTTWPSTAAFDNVALQTLSAPTAVTATLVSTGSVNLNWGASTTATGYQIQRSVDKVNFSTIATVGNVTSYVDSAISAGTTYYYRVIAVNFEGTSSPSASAPVVQPPTVPTVTISDSPVGVSLSWTASNGAASYNIYRGVTGGGESATPIASGLTSTSYLDTQLLTGIRYYYYVTATSAVVSGVSYQSGASNEVSTVAGVISTVPGVIQAANYDLGGQGVAYNSASTVNQGGAYRNDGVGVEGSSTTGYDLGYVMGGEWLNYTVSVQTTGYYTFSLQVATPDTGGSLHLSIDGTNYTGSLSVPNTGSWGTYTALTSSPVKIVAGTHVMRLTFDQPVNGYVCNVRTITVAAATAPNIPIPTGVQISDSAIGVKLSWTAAANATGYNVYRGTSSGGESIIASGITALTYSDTALLTGTKYYYYVTALTAGPGATSYESAASTEVSTIAGVVSSVPGVIQAANYDLGGQGVAYNTVSTVNLGGAYRNDGISIQTNTVANSGGYNIGWTLAGEWLNYTISVPSTGYFSFTLQVATPNTGGALHLAIDGTNVSGELTVPNTGSWTTYTSIVTGPVLIAAGKHVMQLEFDQPTTNNNVCNVTTITVASVVPAAPTSLTATGLGGSIALSWKAGANDVTYNIYRSTSAGGESSTPLATGVGTTSFSDTTAVIGTKYFYTVTGVYGSTAGTAVQSATSTEASATSVLAAVGDGSFENTSVNGSYVYDPTTVFWKFTGNTGIEANGSAWNAASAPDGTQAAFLQTLNAAAGGSLAQTINFAAQGTYQFSFAAAERVSYGVEPITVSLDGAVLTTITPSTTSFQSFTTPSVSLLAGSHILAFSTASTASTDAASFIDKVGINVVSTASSAPTAVTATAGVGQIALAWNAPTGAVSYDIYRGTAPGGESSTPLVTGVTNTSYIDSTAVPGTPYYYTVTAVDGNPAPYNVQSASSAEVSATITVVKVAAAPTGLTATAAVGSIALSWTAGTNDATYSIYRGTTAGGEGTTPLASGVTVTSYTDTTATPGISYFYTVSAQSSNPAPVNAQSAVSSEVSATVTTVKITGTPIGTSTSWLNNGDTIAQVFDGNFNTYFDAPNSSLTNWVGLDLGSARTITQIQYAPRAGFEWRMVGGQFQASSTPDFSSNVVTLFTISTAPVAGQFTVVPVAPGGAYRYVRYVGGTGWVNIAEMEVDGIPAAPVPTKLTGTPIGTSTSWLNNGDTIAQVFDGNFNTYFDAPNSNLTNWVGLNLGAARTITQIQYAPRAGYEWRMVGGQFQVSSTPDFSSNVVTLFTISTAPIAGQFTVVPVAPGGAYQYVRYVGGTGWVNIAEMEVDGLLPAPVSAKLTGTPIGTSTSWLNNGDTIAQVFDGNFNTYFDAPDSNLTDWVGLDLGSAKTITQIKFAPRAGYEWRMVGGEFQVSNTADFSSGVTTIYTITTAPVAGQFTTVSVTVPSTYRYIRYVGGTGWVNIAEMEVDGY